jgi:hypothetical protein
MASLSRLLPLLFVVASGACWSGSLYADRPRDRAVDAAVDQMWADEIRRVARDGDWILSRSLTPQGDFIVTITRGEEFSHASMVDVTRGTIIEAITPVVRELPLEELLARNRYVVVVRPYGLTAEESKAALERARGELGKEFDFFGFIGYPEPGKWYCTELVYWASGFEETAGAQAVIVPSELVQFGEVIYYSGRRDDSQVQTIAAARMNIGHDTAIAGAATAEDDESSR